jgi:hypothetical protein
VSAQNWWSGTGEVTDESLDIVDLTVANWSLTNPRYYAISKTGSDINAGFSDVDMATAGTKALLTIAQLRKILPPNGAGRSIVIAFGPGTWEEDLDLRGIDGYRQRLVRSTADFSNSASDKIVCAAVQAQAGPDIGGKWTCAGGATTLTLSVASGTLSSEPALIQKRLRFLSTTTTVALRNFCVNINANTTTAITVGKPLPAVPAAGDVFVIEQPATYVQRIIDEGADALDTALAASSVSTPYASPVAIVGITSTSPGTFTTPSVSVSRRFAAMSFCEVNNPTSGLSVIFRGCTSATVRESYFDETAAEIVTGVGLRSEQRLVVDKVQEGYFSALGLMNASAPVGSFVNNVQQLIYGKAGSYFASGNQIRAVGATLSGSPANSTSTRNFIGSFTQESPTRFNFAFAGTSHIDLEASNVAIQNCNLISGTFACIRIQGLGLNVVVDGVTGASGNANVGIDTSGCFQSTFRLGVSASNTVTGSVGNIKAAASVIATHAGLTLTNFVDSNGNNYVGSAGRIVDNAKLFSNLEGTPLAVGELVRVSGTLQVVRAQADTFVHSSGALFAALTTPAAGAVGMFVSVSAPLKWLQFNAAPALSGIAYLHTSTGQASTTVPPNAATNQKRRLGCVSEVSGSLGLVTGSLESLPVTSDGLA